MMTSFLPITGITKILWVSKVNFKTLLVDIYLWLTALSKKKFHDKFYNNRQNINRFGISEGRIGV